MNCTFLHVLPQQRSKSCRSKVLRFDPTEAEPCCRIAAVSPVTHASLYSSVLQILAGQLLPGIGLHVYCTGPFKNLGIVFASYTPLLKNLCSALSCALKQRRLCV